MNCSPRLLVACLGGCAVLQSAELIPVSVGHPDRVPPLSASGPSGSPVFADSGRTVFFLSSATDLTHPDAAQNPAVLNLFARDLVTGSVKRISIAGSPEGERGSVYGYAVSADGRRVVFSRSGSDPALGDTNGVADIYWRDLESDTTRLLSVRDDGEGAGNGPSQDPMISADGRYVVFETAATDLEAEPSADSGSRVYLRDLTDGTLVRIHRTVDEQPEPAAQPLISADGSVVVYATERTQHPLDTGLRVWQRATGIAEAIHLPEFDGTRVLGWSGLPDPVLGDDGRTLAFAVLMMDQNNHSETSIWWLDLESGELLRVFGNEPLSLWTLMGGTLSSSADGRSLAFSLESADAAEPRFRSHIWKHGAGLFTLGELVEASGPSGNEPVASEPVLSPDGTRLLFVSEQAFPEAGVTESGVRRLYHRVLATGATRLLDEAPGIGIPRFSPDGTRVVFETTKPEAGGDDPQELGILMVSLTDFERELVSRVIPGDGQTTRMASGISTSGPGISDDGRRLAFISLADDVVLHDRNRLPDLFVFHRDGRTNELVSQGPDGWATGRVDQAALSGQGNHVVFLQTPPGPIGEIWQRYPRVHVRDLVAGTTTEIAEVDASGHPIMGPCEHPVISADGRYVAFYFTEVRLEPLEPDGPFQAVGVRRSVKVKELETGHTWSVDSWSGFRPPQLANDGSTLLCDFAGNRWQVFHRHGNSWQPGLQVVASFVRLSANGRFLFVSQSGFPESSRGLFVMEARSGSERRLLEGPLSQISEFQATPDGSMLTYVRRTRPADPALDGPRQIYTLSVATGQEELISTTPEGEPGSADSRDPRISAGGRYVVFRSDAPDLVAGDTEGVPDVFLRDRYTGTTRRLSQTAEGLGGVLNSSRPDISKDGAWVAFTTFASNLLPGDGNGLGDVVLTPVPQVAAPDTDADGLPDGWELDHFGSLGRDGAGDADGDGYTDLEEYLARTHPGEGTLHPSLAVRLGSHSEGAFEWPSHAGVAYQVQRRPHLVGGSNAGWEDVGPLLQGFEGRMWTRIVVEAGYFRVQIRPRVPDDQAP
ncbi:MAG: PD40 domain-containing protein [Verrucomicrobiae bacterium]|nr:PD40 domain-containing protein [Verrucomicrobiae bacterium]